MPKARPRLSAEMADMDVPAWERLLAITNLGREDREIARLYYIEQLPQIDIATEVMMDRATVSRRLSKIRKRIEKKSME